ncbi:MAG: hypothetical protein K0S38_936 [Candidatus Paceibacter sp.]|jgi:hypothetical protein|nr:hypothetical protein [Candidatus Paceibacter sp.]
MKKLPYWVKGGIIFTSIAVLVLAWRILCPADTGCSINIDLLFFPVILLPGQFAIIGYFLFYFLLGALLGFIYGKFKNRGKQS